MRNPKKKKKMIETRRHIIKRLLAAALTIVLSASCSTIDDDLSDCGTDFELDYELWLITNMNTELQTELSMETDINVAQSLREFLGGIFTDFAHDVDLSFYETEGTMPRLQHDKHIIDGNQASYTIYLPKRQYMHLAAANLVENKLVSLSGDENCPTSVLQQIPGDTITSHNTGLYTARESMEVLEGVNQTFNVRLFMANCAEALVIDPRGQDIRDIKVVTTGFATQFSIKDSTYHYAALDPIVKAERVDREGDGKWCFCSVNFPSRESEDVDGTRSVVETEDPFIAQPGDKVLWQFRVYLTLADGSMTETVLSVKKPSRAGQLTIIKGYITDKGTVEPVDQTVGVSVTLDWHQGNEHEVPL